MQSINPRKQEIYHSGRKMQINPARGAGRNVRECELFVDGLKQ